MAAQLYMPNREEASKKCRADLPLSLSLFDVPTRLFGHGTERPWAGEKTSFIRMYVCVYIHIGFSEFVAFNEALYNTALFFFSEI